jgi:small-conductance mechanosensitive channel
MMLFKYLFLIIIIFFLFGASLAFGIGARHAISHLLAMRNVRHYYKIGQVVKVKDIEGQVIDIKTHVIVLQTATGKAIIPGDIFYENITLLLEP